MSRKLIRKRRIFKTENWKIGTVPNLLTFSRIALIPVLIFSFFLKEPWSTLCPLLLFMGASFTDFMDGYIARKFEQTSKFGAFLDPMADKLLVCVTLLMLAGTGSLRGVHLIPAALILCREIVISGLREFLAATGQELQVSWLAQYKTCIQMLAISLLLGRLPGLITALGLIFLWISALLTAITGVAYIKASFSFIREKQSRLRKLLKKTKKYPQKGQSEPAQD
ncbi:CDP-diacylglycerol--glycerol-3-phosphate 3-phosphatidyltransferase [Alphaproteobacteria bacterium]|nr:CDP-diacylglycerol--glycerol-3-phosphate 3-phosphatidyltransferase [Alphaproteobacteria bacterium]GHS98521.1 CDP-diacylglycerol--glycerol-3-phosphate 3-phosphatidyltransferase [Alphaproteobacteria bacterium]